MQFTSFQRHIYFDVCIISEGIFGFSFSFYIQLQMLSAIRQSVDIPVDVHTENPASTGGFIRHYEVPEMIRIASPIYLKTGGSVAKNHSWDTSEPEARARAKQVQLVKRMIDSYYPEAISSEKNQNNK